MFEGTTVIPTEPYRILVKGQAKSNLFQRTSELITPSEIEIRFHDTSPPTDDIIFTASAGWVVTLEFDARHRGTGTLDLDFAATVVEGGASPRESLDFAKK